MKKIKHEIKPWYCSGCSERMFDYCPCCAKCGKPHPENTWRVATEAALTNKEKEIKRLEKERDAAIARSGKAIAQGLIHALVNDELKSENQRFAVREREMREALKPTCSCGGPQADKRGGGVVHAYSCPCHLFRIGDAKKKALSLSSEDLDRILEQIKKESFEKGHKHGLRSNKKA